MRVLALIFMLGFVYSCKPQNAGNQAPSSQELLGEMVDDQRMMTPEDLADYLINQDPSIKIIDVRDEDAFMDFTLPGAELVTLSELEGDFEFLNEECEIKKLVFISNSGILAEKAWLLSRLQGCKSGYVLKGGLNEWVEKIMQPEEPSEGDPASVWELYNRRIGARNYFAGISTEFTPSPYLVPKPQKKTVSKKKAEEEEEEGC